MKLFEKHALLISNYIPRRPNEISCTFEGGYGAVDEGSDPGPNLAAAAPGEAQLRAVHLAVASGLVQKSLPAFLERHFKRLRKLKTQFNNHPSLSR